jgi:hypothetical protein
VWLPFTGSRETIERAAAGNFGAVVHQGHRGVTEDIVGYFAKSLAAHGFSLGSDQLCLFTDAWVAESAGHALDEYAPYYLYFNQVLWHHGSSAPGQSANPAASGYIAETSYDYVRPEHRAHVALDRERIRRTSRADVEARVANGELAFGSPRQVIERLIASAEQLGADSLLLNMNLGALPHAMHLEQVRRFARDVLPALQAHRVTRVPAAQEVA